MSQVQNEDTALPLYIRVYNIALLNNFELNINKKDSPEGATYFTSYFKCRFHPDDRLGRLNPFFLPYSPPPFHPLRITTKWKRPLSSEIRSQIRRKKILWRNYIKH